MERFNENEHPEITEHQLEELMRAFSCESVLFKELNSCVTELADEREKAKFKTTTMDGVIKNFAALDIIHSGIEDVMSGDPVRMQGATEMFESFEEMNKTGSTEAIWKWAKKWGIK